MESSGATNGLNRAGAMGRRGGALADRSPNLLHEASQPRKRSTFGQPDPTHLESRNSSELVRPELSQPSSSWSSTESSDHELPSQQHKPLWHQISVSKHLRDLVDRMYYQCNVVDVAFIDEATLKVMSAMSPGIQRYVAEALQFKREQAGGLENPRSKTSPYITGVLKKVCKNTKYEPSLRQALLKNGLETSSPQHMQQPLPSHSLEQAAYERQEGQKQQHGHTGGRKQRQQQQKQQHQSRQQTQHRRTSANQSTASATQTPPPPPPHPPPSSGNNLPWSHGQHFPSQGQKRRPQGDSGERTNIDDESAYKLLDLGLHKALKFLNLPFHLSRMTDFMQKHEQGWTAQRRTSFANFLTFLSSLPAQEIMEHYGVRLEKSEPSEWRINSIYAPPREKHVTSPTRKERNVFKAFPCAIFMFDVLRPDKADPHRKFNRCDRKHRAPRRWVQIVCEICATPVDHFEEKECSGCGQRL